jgi:colicin import membrane protein
MKKLLIVIFMLMPMLATAQDNTWERIEQEPVEKENPDAKYLVKGIVPEVDGKVCFETNIKAPGKSADEIYRILLQQMEKMVKEPNQIANSIVAVKDSVNHELGAVFHEWLVFKNAALSLDRTQMNFQLLVSCKDGEANVKMTRITYDYDTARKPQHYSAEEWITDKYAVNKKGTKLYPISGKFRRKTIDRKDFIFNKFDSLLNEKK